MKKSLKLIMKKELMRLLLTKTNTIALNYGGSKS